VPRRLDATDPSHRDDAVASAAEALNAGQLVAFPTETVYGLGALASDPEAVARVYALKGRPRGHPLIVHVAEAAALGGWAAAVPEAAWDLASAFWPGPLTLVLRAGERVPSAVTGGHPTVAVRVPGHPLALAILRALGPGAGVAAPSANRFGRISPTSAQHVLDDFASEDDLLVLDGGPCSVGLESTIVDVSGAAPRLLRPGGVPAAAIVARIGPLATDLTAPISAAPGSHARHYAPDVATELIATEALDAVPDDVAVVARRPAAPQRHAGAAPWAQLPDDPNGYGRELYATLRRLERAAPRAIWIEQVPADEAWRAVRDRLTRASHAAQSQPPSNEERS